MKIVCFIFALMIVAFIPVNSYAMARVMEPPLPLVYELLKDLVAALLTLAGVTQGPGVAAADWDSFVEWCYNSFTASAFDSDHKLTAYGYDLLGKFGAGSIVYVAYGEYAKWLMNTSLMTNFQAWIADTFKVGSYDVTLPVAFKFECTDGTLIGVTQTNLQSLGNPRMGTNMVAYSVQMPMHTTKTIELQHNLDVGIDVTLTLETTDTHRFHMHFYDLGVEIQALFFDYNAGSDTTSPYYFCFYQDPVGGLFSLPYRNCTNGYTYAYKGAAEIGATIDNFDKTIDLENPQGLPNDVPINVGDDIGMDVTPDPGVDIGIDDGTVTIPWATYLELLSDLNAALERTDTETFTPPTMEQWNVPNIAITKFPFCLPYDLAAIIYQLNVEREPIVFTMPFEIPGIVDYDVVIDLTSWEPVAAICRACTDILFAIGLIVLTRKIIGA